MNTQEFLKILRNPKQLRNEQVFEIEDILRNFPYFQAARAVYLKGLKIHNSFRYNQELKITAAYSTDRSVLFNFITSDDFNVYNDQKAQHFIEEIGAIDEAVKQHIVTSFDKETTKPDSTQPDESGFTAESDILLANEGKEESATVEKESESTDESLREETTNPVPTSQSEAEEGIFVNPMFDIDFQAKDAGEEVTSENTQSTHVAGNDVAAIHNDGIAHEAPEQPGLIFEMDSEDEIEESDLDIRKTAEVSENLTFEPLINKVEKEEILSPDVSVDAPFDFTKEDTFSFKEWLQLSHLKPIDRSEDTETTDAGLKDKMHLINTFIEKNPKIKPVKSKLHSSVVISDEVDESQVMTETLARVYTKQEKYDSAIKAYEILSLKFPKKSGFFADQIKKLKKLKQKHKNT